MITPIVRLPALVAGEPVVIVGFDATHALCVWGDGHLDYVEHRELRVEFYRDLEMEVWFTYGGQDDGSPATGSDDEVQSAGASGSDADALSRADGFSDSDVVEPAG